MDKQILAHPHYRIQVNITNEILINKITWMNLKTLCEAKGVKSYVPYDSICFKLKNQNYFDRK